MSKFGWITMVAMGLVAGVLAGVLIASGDDEQQTVATVTSEPLPAATSTTRPDVGAVTVPVEPDDVPLTATERRRVERAALAIAGGGTMTDVDRSDDPGEAYEVEVITDRGEIDIALDQDLRRVDNSRYDD